MFVTNEPKLTKGAQSKIDEYKAKIQEAINGDRVREPKLTGDEKKEIAELRARIEHLTPINQELLVLLETKDASLKHLERGGAMGMVIDNVADLDKLVGELVLLKPAIQLLSQAYNATDAEIAQANDKIKNISEAARQRELAQENAK
jgi:hypothetical protein